MTIKATKNGMHIREGERVKGMACWELWDGDNFLSGAFGAMSFTTVGALADYVSGTEFRNPGFDWVLPTEFKA